MMTYLSILAAFLLFLALAAALVRSRRAANGSDLNEVAEPSGACDPEFSLQILDRVFSKDDQAFLKELDAPQIERLLLTERKRIALRWIRRNTAEARIIMRDHLRMARSAKDLRVSGELRLTLRYLELRLLCAVLFWFVLVLGPTGLRGLAAQAHAVLSGLRTPGIADETRVAVVTTR